MFWGLVLKTNKRYSQTITKGFHVSSATLDLNTVEKDTTVQVWVHTDGTDHLIGNLNKQTSQLSLDLVFTEGEDVSFYSKGNGTIHLNGYIIAEDEFGPPDLGEEEDIADNDVDLDQFKKLVANSNKKQATSSDDESDDEDFNAEAALLNQESDDDEIGEEEEDDDDDEDEDDDDDDDDDDDEDDDDDDDDDEEDSEDEEVAMPPAKQAKLDKSLKQNGLANGKLEKKKVQSEQQKGQQQKNQKNQQNDNKQKDQKKDKQPQKKRTLSGGVIVEDLQVGKGPEAQPGKRVTVYYEGRLKSNNKVFDSTLAGEGFNFVLGRNEVIKGWDIGVAGMRVGSKRKIICPPNAAYGSRGQPPVIPANSTLVFNVELRAIK